MIATENQPRMPSVYSKSKARLKLRCLDEIRQPMKLAASGSGADGIVFFPPCTSSRLFGSSLFNPLKKPQNQRSVVPSPHSVCSM